VQSIISSPKISVWGSLQNISPTLVPTKTINMSPLIRNILAVIAGLIIGGIVNASIITLGPNVILPPEGVDPNDIESIKANVAVYEMKHFIIPLLAHALGTLVGAFTAVKLGISKHKTLSYIVAGVFFIPGSIMAIILPEFWIFSIIDLLIAYFPMAILGWIISGKFQVIKWNKRV
jgi:hypothetical protein